MSNTEAQPTGGSPEHLLQDQSRDLSRALAGKPGARLHATEAAAALAQPATDHRWNEGYKHGLWQGRNCAQPAASGEPAGFIWRIKLRVEQQRKAFPGEDPSYLWKYEHGTERLADCEQDGALEVIALYATAQPAPARVPLTDEQIEALALKHEDFGFGQVDASGLTTHGFSPSGLAAFARAIEAAHGITAPGAPDAQKGEA